jgi:hypothetical protein
MRGKTLHICADGSAGFLHTARSIKTAHLLNGIATALGLRESRLAWYCCDFNRHELTSGVVLQCEGVKL